LLPLALYARIPESLPFHWNLAGQVDNWVDKSWATVEAMPLLMAFVTGMMMVFSLVLRSVKQEINPENPGRSVAQNRLFRLRWSKYLLASAVAIDLVFTVVNLNILNLVPLSPSLMLALMFGLAALTMVYTLILTARDGQGGSYILVPDDGQSAGAPRDDDGFYKWGLFYVNPDDPALWVEKRYGVGWTLNFGNRRSWLVMGALLAFIAAMGLLPWLLARSDIDGRAAEAIQPCAQPVVDNLFEGMKARDYERAVKDFSPEMLAALDATKMRQQCEGVFIPRIGVPETWRYEKAQAKGGFVSLVYRADFTLEKGVTVRIVFRPRDPELKVQGLWLDSPTLRN
jgi:hypothetical protein